MTSGTPNDLRGICGSPVSSSDVLAVGSGGVVLRYDGSGWNAMSVGATRSLRGIWASSENDIIAVGHGGTILHYNGRTWSSVAGSLQHDLVTVCGSSGDDILAAGEHGTILRCCPSQ